MNQQNPTNTQYCITIDIFEDVTRNAEPLTSLAEAIYTLQFGRAFLSASEHNIRAHRLLIDYVIPSTIDVTLKQKFIDLLNEFPPNHNHPRDDSLKYATINYNRQDH